MIGPGLKSSVLSGLDGLPVSHFTNTNKRCGPEISFPPHGVSQLLGSCDLVLRSQL